MLKIILNFVKHNADSNIFCIFVLSLVFNGLETKKNDFMKKYKFEILETGHVRTYNSFGVCMYQGIRCMRSLMKRGLIFCNPEIMFYSVEDGIKTLVSVETLSYD